MADTNPVPTRPARPTVDEIRAVCQPDSVRSRYQAEHWAPELYLRRVSPYITRLLVRTPITANQVSGATIGIAGATALALLIPGLPGSLLAVLLGQLQMLIDCCDGEVARWRQTFSPAGIFLDKVSHYTAEGLIPIALGIRASGWPLQPLEPAWYPYLGALAAALVIYNKALNDMVHAARGLSGLPKLADKESVAVPRTAGLRRVRALARFVPFHRAYHSVEMTLLALVAAVVDAVAGDLIGTQVLVAGLAALGLLTVVGHVIAILSSSRLR